MTCWIVAKPTQLACTPSLDHQDRHGSVRTSLLISAIGRGARDACDHWVNDPAMPVSGDTHRLSASQASHRVPAADRRQAHVYYNRYYTPRNDEGPLTK